MIRLLLLFGGDYLFTLLLWIGAVTALLAVISALAQSDAKRLLAYHSVSQMGYILAVFGAGSSLALTAAFFHAISHALFKSLLFLTVGTAIKVNGERNLYRMAPSGRKLPVFSLAFFAGALSIAGIAPFNGFASKAFISQGMKGSAAYPVLWITSFLTIASFIKLSRIYLPGPKENIDKTIGGAVPLPGKPAGILAGISVVSLAVLCLAGGLFGPRIGVVLQALLKGAPLTDPPKLLSISSILKLLPPLILGSAFYLWLKTHTGKELSRRIRSFNPSLHTVLSFFFLGLIGFSIAAY
jgi:multicomponent Na+:H+ antiporter subunit D